MLNILRDIFRCKKHTINYIVYPTEEQDDVEERIKKREAGHFQMLKLNHDKGIQERYELSALAGVPGLAFGCSQAQVYYEAERERIKHDLERRETQNRRKQRKKWKRRVS